MTEKLQNVWNVNDTLQHFPVTLERRQKMNSNVNQTHYVNLIVWILLLLFRDSQSSEAVGQEPETATEDEKQEEEVDIDLEDPNVGAAATKIQAGFRGHKARKEIKEKKVRLTQWFQPVNTVIFKEKRIQVTPSVDPSAKLNYHMIWHELAFVQWSKNSSSWLKTDIVAI